MKRLLILNGIDDAQHLAKNLSLFKDKECAIFSTHYAVDIFLNENYQITCNCLSKFLTSETAFRNIRLADELANETVDYLDSLYADELNDKAGLKKLKFFKPIYGYLAYFQLNTYMNLIESLKNLIEKYDVKEIIFFEKKINRFFDTGVKLGDILRFFNSANISPVDIKEENKRIYDFHRPMLRLKRFKDHPQLLCKKTWAKVKRIVRLNSLSLLKGAETILIFEPLYDLAFLRDFISKYKVIRYASDSAVPVGYKCLSGVDYGIALRLNKGLLHNEKAEGARTYIKRLIMQDIEEDFAGKINSYLNYLSLLHDINRKQGIRLGIWGCSPTFGFKPLVFEYLMANNISVIGCQHGGMLGNQYNHDVYISDASRCTDYISYGFSKDDLKKIYPEKDFSGVRIYPFGTTKPTNNKRSKKKVIDILFPLTNCMSMLEGGMMREKPETIGERQEALARYLDALEGYRVVIKPFAYSDYSNCAIFAMLKKLRHAEVINNFSFLEMLDLFDVRSVLIEHPSTPLYEALAYDLDIFLLNDSVRPIEKTALDELKKRVHYSEDIGEIISKIGVFLKGALEKKRDDTFYRHCVYKDYSKDKILNLIEEISTNKFSC